MALTLTEAAARRITKITATSENKALGVRLEVLGGGCAGFQYKFSLTEALEPGDNLIERDNAKLIVDQTSMEYLEGSEVDFGESLMEAGFQVRNPRAASSCGCGTSFAMKE